MFLFLGSQVRPVGVTTITPGSTPIRAGTQRYITKSPMGQTVKLVQGPSGTQQIISVGTPTGIQQKIVSQGGLVTVSFAQNTKTFVSSV